MDNSAIMYNEAIESFKEETKPIPIDFNEKKATFKTQSFYISLAFLLITIALLKALSVYCYMTNYRVKQKHLLPFHFTNNKLKEIIY